MILLSKLLLAHLIGDFILQPRTWVEQKERNKLKAWQLYVHVIIHLILILVFVWDFNFLVPALLITASHLLIDAAKIILQNSRTKRIWFISDQALHIIVLICFWMYFAPTSIDFEFLQSHQFWFIVTALVFITAPTSVLIKTLISQWTPKSSKDINMESLPEAGKFIGILERLFILLFISTSHWEAVGFLLAAKSVFRFGDLKDAHDRKLTEYVLIGTLLSFGIAMITGLALNYLLTSGDGMVD